MDHMPGAGGGQVRAGRAVKAACAGENDDVGSSGRVEVGGLTAAVAVADNSAVAQGPVAAYQQPTADAEALKGGIFNFAQVDVGVITGDGACGGLGVDGEGLAVGILPEIGESIGRGRGGHLHEHFQGVVVSWVEGEMMGKWHCDSLCPRVAGFGFYM